jgi:hypothetical protein
MVEGYITFSTSYTFEAEWNKESSSRLPSKMASAMSKSFSNQLCITGLLLSLVRKYAIGKVRFLLGEKN